MAENTVYEGSVLEFAGKKLKDIRTTDLKLIRDAEPVYADAINESNPIIIHFFRRIIPKRYTFSGE